MTLIAPTHGMVLSAGLGMRMRPITKKTPKPLIPVAGRALVDHAIDRLAEAGVEQVVINTHHLAERIEGHLVQRPSPKITFSPEPRLLETGGGVKAALALLGEAPFYVVNGDAFWLNGSVSALGRLAEIWDDGRMDALLLLKSTVDAYGYDGCGDFGCAPDGLLSRRLELEVSPWLFTGIQLLHRRLFEASLEGAFSLNVLYDRAIKAGRLFGIIHDGEWFHVGTAAGLAAAETYLSARFAGVERR